ncbi:MAG: 30S ribosome-binding factor RbfA [Chloroflexi bacterium]|nr:MAG: 30S ribosome-binding factor RbfA [Chloroflexota bacterium]
MSERRRQQVADLLRDHISEIIQREMRDPRLGFVSVTRVEVSPDIRMAKVFVSVFGTEEEQRDAMVALSRATGFVRKQLGDRLEMRFVPELSFRQDRSMQHAESVARLLRQIEREDAARPITADRAEGVEP